MRHCLPVVFQRADRLLRHMIRADRPDVVLCLGQAGGATAVAVETSARNIRDARIPDNDGRMPRGEPVVAGGPANLGPTLPLGLVHRALESAGVATVRSDSAGTYLCNDVFYTLMHEVHTATPSLCASFLHLPGISDNRPAVEAESLVRGVWDIIGALLTA